MCIRDRVRIVFKMTRQPCCNWLHISRIVHTYIAMCYYFFATGVFQKNIHRHLNCAHKCKNRIIIKLTSRTYSCTYVYVRKQQQKTEKTTRTTATWNDVAGKLMTHGRAYRIKLQWSSVFFYWFDYQSWSMILKRTKLIGALLVVLE